MWVLNWTATVSEANQEAVADGDTFTFTGQATDGALNLGSVDFTAMAATVNTQLSAALAAQFPPDLSQDGGA